MGAPRDSPGAARFFAGLYGPLERWPTTGEDATVTMREEVERMLENAAAGGALGRSSRGQLAEMIAGLHASVRALEEAHPRIIRGSARDQFGMSPDIKTRPPT